MTRVSLFVSLALSTSLFVPLQAQTVSHGTVQRIVVHGNALESNLMGDSPDRNVSLYLPPSYATDASRRYPVLYLLHGYGDTDADWFTNSSHYVNVPQAADASLAAGTGQEMIIVMPNAYNRYHGSMYSNSITAGNWEAYITKDLVDYIDKHYRTLPFPASRGLAGHSMGGYGAFRIGRLHPGVFSSVYLMSPCCMTPLLPTSLSVAALPDGTRQAIQAAEQIRTLNQFDNTDFLTQSLIASLAAWAPDPVNPPLYFDPLSQNGTLQALTLSKLLANAPLANIDQFIPKLKRLHAIAFDAGNLDTDNAAALVLLDQDLTSYSIAHSFEIYAGDHTNQIGTRLATKVLPFFSQQLSFTGPVTNIRR